MPQQPRVRNAMADRVRLALDIAAPGTIPLLFEAAYRRGGTPTSLHLNMLAAAAGTTPRWLMTGHPETAAPTHIERTSP